MDICPVHGEGRRGCRGRDEGSLVASPLEGHGGHPQVPSSAVDVVLPFGDDDELGRKVATLATGAIVTSGSAPTAAKADGHYERHCRGYEDFCLWYLTEEHAERERIASMQTALKENGTKF